MRWHLHDRLTVVLRERWWLVLLVFFLFGEINEGELEGSWVASSTGLLLFLRFAIGGKEVLGGGGRG